MKASRLIIFSLIILVSIWGARVVFAQQSAVASLPAQAPNHISDFVSIEPIGKTTRFQLPPSHTFQYLVEEGTPYDSGGANFPSNFDFTGFVPISGSSTSGVLGLNHELVTGGVSMMDVVYDEIALAWVVTNTQAVDFTAVGGTSRPCSGGITPWEMYVSCEEYISADSNEDGYHDSGWCVEIDPASRNIIDQPGDLDGADKLWAIGNFQHENLVVHPNERTAYTGRDHVDGYLYRFVADTAQDLSAGDLFVYRETTASTGEWVQLANTTVEERNSTIQQSEMVSATVFSGIEDVEIGPDGMVYFAVKGAGMVYRLRDDQPITGTAVSLLEPYVGGQSYDISHANGVTSLDWGVGNDNLAFDDLGNLWVLQDGGDEYIWMVEAGHSQITPTVKLFGTAPLGAEPTGITFTPDFKFLFMSIQHPSAMNAITTQPDAFGIPRAFDKNVALVIALDQSLAVPTAVGVMANSAELNSLSPLMFVFLLLFIVLTLAGIRQIRR